jgi:hypothetical protein
MQRTSGSTTATADGSAARAVRRATRRVVAALALLLPALCAAETFAADTAGADLVTSLPGAFATGMSLGTVAWESSEAVFPAPGLARPAWVAGTATAPIKLSAKPWHSARLIEIPRDAGPGQQQVTRPRYALGFQSPGLKNFLTHLGMEPHSCLAPIVRLRTKISNGGDVSGTFWLYARCSFR